MTGEVGFADHADYPLIVHHRQAADLVLPHHLQDVVDVRFRVHGEGLALGQLAGGHGARVDTICYAFDHDVSVSDDAVQAIVVAADRKRPDIEVAHLPRRVLQGLPVADALRSGVHDVPRSCHCEVPLFARACCGPLPDADLAKSRNYVSSSRAYTGILGQCPVSRWFPGPAGPFLLKDGARPRLAYTLVAGSFAPNISARPGGPAAQHRWA